MTTALLHAAESTPMPFWAFALTMAVVVTGFLGLEFLLRRSLGR